jgi:uncharacterized membrane protein (DUF373 family)
MSDKDPTPPPDNPSDTAEPGPPGSLLDQYSFIISGFVQGVELAAATVFAVLFAIGVVDLTLQIFEAVRTGDITDPLVVISFIDTGLLLLIIVEVYNTVLAYVRENETRQIVQLVIYTGVIAMVRKAIIFRTGEYATTTDALFAAGSYAIIIFALVALLLAEQTYGSDSALQAD